MNENTSAKFWQTAFVIGVVTCVITAVLVLGQALAMAIVSMVSLIITVINSLLNLQPDKSGEPKTFSSFLKNMLYVGPLLKVATFLVWCGVLGLAAHGLASYTQANRLVTIKGMVLTAKGALAENARVTLVLDGGRERTEIAKEGKFAFEKVDTSKEPAGRVLLKVRWQDASGESTVDLGKGRPGEVTVTLSPGQPPFRVSYRILNTMALDQLLRDGEIPKEWEESLAGKPYIIPNGQLLAVQSLFKRFSVPFTDQFINVGDFENKAISERLTAKRKNTPIFIGVDFTFFTQLESFQAWQSALLPLETWRIITIQPVAALEKRIRQELFQHTKINPESSFFLTLRKFSTREDLRKIAGLPLDSKQKKFLDYILAITEGGMPPDFCELNLLSLQGCPESSGWHLMVQPRQMQLRVAVIENITSRPIYLQNFQVRENLSQTIRSRTADQRALQDQEIQKRDWFSLESLKPGEKILVPLEISFGNEGDTSSQEEARPDQGELNPTISRLQRLEQAAIPFPVLQKVQRTYDGQVYLESVPTGKAEVLIVPAQTLLRGLQQPVAPPQLEKEYIYGPSAKIDSLEMDDVTYAFREFDPKQVVLYAGLPMGSCPFVYTYEPETGAWRQEGQILYGKNSKYLEGAAEKLLTRFDGRVLLKEEEPEISFIDFLQIRIVSPDGRERTVLPENLRLEQPDGDYVILHRGEQLEVAFPGSAPQPGEKVVLVARGYYLVEQKR